jgi:ElaB/YqjD/DUF883 family membrane-anchored ribosome-binding protein
MAIDTNGNRKIDEALHLLNEAARDKKDELHRLLGEKYLNIKDALTEVAMSNKDVLEEVKRVAQERIAEGREKVEEVISDVDSQVKRNPWPYIGGAAAAALLVGYIMGSSKR